MNGGIILWARQCFINESAVVGLTRPREGQHIGRIGVVEEIDRFVVDIVHLGMDTNITITAFIHEQS